MKDSQLSSDLSLKWTILCWVMGTICVPVLLPYAVCRILRSIRYKKSKISLPGKVVVITGASSGLGEALAHSFYSSGCQVVLAARRLKELERVQKELQELQLVEDVTSYSPKIIQLDLEDINSMQGKVDEILETFGKIDILINNGGISVRSDILSTKMDVDIKVMLVNHFGTVALTKAVLPSMVQRKEGHIVCISSVQGKYAIPQRSAYTASKHALQAFCDSLRAEVDEYKIKVTVISPGYISTSLSLNSLTGSGQKYGIMDTTTAGGTSPEKMAEDILNAVLRGERDIIISTVAPKVAYWLRFLWPSLYFWIMARRAHKLSLLQKND